MGVSSPNHGHGSTESIPKYYTQHFTSKEGHVIPILGIWNIWIVSGNWTSNFQIKVMDKHCMVFLHVLHPKKSCSSLKVVSATFFQVRLACLTESTCEIRKNVFYFAKFSGTQMSWRHQMPKHEARNTFYWITWEVSIVW